MDINLVFRIAGIGILVAAITQLLKQTGRDDMALLAAITGLVIGLMMVVGLVADLFDSLRRIFNF